jgi:hypothetical protein
MESLICFKTLQTLRFLSAMVYNASKFRTLRRITMEIHFESVGGT